MHSWEKAQRRTVDAASTSKTLPSLNGRSAAPKCRAPSGNILAYGTRARRKVAMEVHWNGVCRVVIRCGTRLE